MVGIQLKCKKHPRYKGKIFPKECLACSSIFSEIAALKQVKKVAESSDPHFPGLLVKIKS